MLETDQAGLAPGAHVVLQGLSSAQAQSLNGLSGTLGTREGDRWKVWLRGSDTWKALRPQNLRVETFPPRARVILHGLLKAPELNGCVGIVVSPCAAASGRYEVDVMGRGRKALLAASLRIATGTEASRSPTCVSVIAPGAGLHANASFYEALQKDRTLFLRVDGSSRAPYDRYPPHWQGGAPPPNLESFASDLVASDAAEAADVLVFGSRGGQVVLPEFWRQRGPEVPPCFVMNGGCLMAGDKPVFWPETAVSMLLIGGRDYFRGDMSSRQYMEFAKGRVPESNVSTAVLLVDEMDHMPQTELLGCVFRDAVRALLLWSASAQPPTSHFESIASSLNSAGWSGQLSYTFARAGRRAWHDVLLSDPSAGASARAQLPVEIRRRTCSNPSGLPAGDPSCSPVRRTYSTPGGAGDPSCSPAAGPVRRSTTQASVFDVSPVAVSPAGFDAPVDYQGLDARSRVEVLYEGEWHRGTVVAPPHEDPQGTGRWSVQCDGDAQGVYTFAAAEFIRWASAEPWPSAEPRFVPGTGLDACARGPAAAADARERSAGTPSQRRMPAC